VRRPRLHPKVEHGGLKRLRQLLDDLRGEVFPPSS
jgi:hypothetical protein